jgi:hypothetical protein
MIDVAINWLRPAFTLIPCSAYSLTLKMEAIYSSETSVDLPHCIISQKIELFITSAVRTSNAATVKVTKGCS